MKITRRFTKDGHDPFDSVKWVRRSSRISNPDGSVVFQMDDAEVPETWSQLATDIMVSKYFRKAGVPQYHHSSDGYDWLGTPKAGDDGKTQTGPERSAKQVIHRLAGCWRWWGEQHGYFDSAEDAAVFYDELVYMLVHQMAAPNSPQWFNTGLNFAYGITGPAQGHCYCDPDTGEVRFAEDAYTHPQPHACFIQEVGDDLVAPGGIMDLWTREARLFKYGSGTGTNFSNVRGENEPLSGGGKSSGLMSFLKIGDRAAGAIKSGGTTRRAAKMVCLDLDHPDIESFVNWKVREEIKVAALVEGLKKLENEKVTESDRETIGETASRLGLNLDYDFNGEAYYTVSGQNSNNSVRIPDGFFDVLDAGDDWSTRWRTNGEVAKTVPAQDLWDQIGYAAWRCADPGVQFDSTINAWHTCPSAGRINASNPCSEYMFLDNTACNLASLNVLKFYDTNTRTFDVKAFEHGVDIWTVVLEISVLMAAFPSAEIAELSYTYRTLGLGYANLGAMLMRAGIPYDSDEGRAVGACITSLLTGRSYRMSAVLAAEHGPFKGYDADAGNMMTVIHNHRMAAHGVERTSDKYKKLRITPVPVDHDLVCNGDIPIANVKELLSRSAASWDDAYELGATHGYRNAQVSVIAPTGTIGLLMDCDTTGVEPDFALVKFKKLAGGGYFKIANGSLDPALETLGYSKDERRDILRSILGTLDLDVPMPKGVKGSKIGMTFGQWLIGRGFNEDDLDKIKNALPGVFELPFAFGAWALGEETLERIGLDAEKAMGDPNFNALKALGMKPKAIEQLNELICGTQTIEGAPHMKDEHLAVFDCASKCGTKGQRFIEPAGHIRMMAAAQPFISGAISKTINLPSDSTVEDITSAYRISWELGLKANALYRDGCKLSQPLNATATTTEELEAELEHEIDEIAEADAKEEVAEEVVAAAAAASVEDKPLLDAARDRITHRPMRRRLPDTRRSITHKFNVAGHEGYLTVGLYDDGLPGELFITMAKEGSTIGGLMDSLGTATSVALQYGVPIQSLVNKFTHQRFEPAGMTANREIPMAKSLVDYIFRWMGIQFIPGYREKVVPKRPSDAEPTTERTPGDAPSRITKGESDWVEPARMRDEPKVVHEASASVATATEVQTDRAVVVQSSTLSAALESAGDAPPCDVCGTITVRSGTCYKCLNCGNSMGCS